MVGLPRRIIKFVTYIRQQFLLCMADSHGCFTPALDIIATCQERVMERDNEGLLEAMIKVSSHNHSPGEQPLMIFPSS